MLLNKKKNQGRIGSENRFLISITVVGSAGPIRFVVRENELVANVIETALKSYAREGRLPVLGSDYQSFYLYCPNSSCTFGPLSPWVTIGSTDARTFMLSKKPEATMEAERADLPKSSHKSGGIWKSWINRSLNLKVPSH